MHPLTVLLALAMVFSGSLLPGSRLSAADDIKISFSRKQLEQQQREDSNVTITETDIVYEIELENKTFDDMANLAVKYKIFYKDQILGKTTDAVEQYVDGEEHVASIPAHRSVELVTAPVKLTKEQLDAGWSYDSGASGKSRDRIVGVWCRVYAGDKQIAEYANPSSLKRRHKWED